MKIHFRKLKDSISNDVCLQYFDTTKVSKVGLGAVLIQKDSKGRDKPVAFASKSLNYSRNQVC